MAITDVAQYAHLTETEIAASGADSTQFGATSNNPASIGTSACMALRVGTGDGGARLLGHPCDVEQSHRFEFLVALRKSLGYSVVERIVFETGAYAAPVGAHPDGPLPLGDDRQPMRRPPVNARPTENFALVTSQPHPALQCYESTLIADRAIIPLPFPSVHTSVKS